VQNKAGRVVAEGEVGKGLVQVRIYCQQSERINDPRPKSALVFHQVPSKYEEQQVPSAWTVYPKSRDSRRKPARPVPVSAERFIHHEFDSGRIRWHSGPVRASTTYTLIISVLKPSISNQRSSGLPGGDGQITLGRIDVSDSSPLPRLAKTDGRRAGRNGIRQIDALRGRVLSHLAGENLVDPREDCDLLRSQSLTLKYLLGAPCMLEARRTQKVWPRGRLAEACRAEKTRSGLL